MEWYFVLTLIVGSFLFLMFLGVPVVYSFLAVNIFWMFYLMGGTPGLLQLVSSIYGSLTIFTLLPIPLFIFMGEILFRSGIAMNMIDAIGKWLYRLPGSVALMTVASGALLGALSGASMGTTAMLGTTMFPEMDKRGYSRQMSLGPILGSGGLAMLIPPSGLGVILAVIAMISVGQLLIAIIVPGLLLALLYFIYVVIRCWLQPSLVPAPDNVTDVTLSEKLLMTLKYILPLGTIIFLVVGVIFLGIGTPTEAAALGALGSIILAACYRMMNWEVFKKAVFSATRISIMVLSIIAVAQAYSQVLAFSGATRGLVQWALSFDVSPLVAVAVMQAVILVMGGFLGPNALIMIVMPVFMPVVTSFGLNPIWFGVMSLLAMEMAQTTPPYGALLFVMKGVAPKDVTMWEIMTAALPFLGLDLILMILLLFVPSIALWLPSLM